MPKITIRSASLSFDCDADDTILHAALRSGLGVPYECNVGSCGNCRFELLDGAIAEDGVHAPGLSERERARNRFLGCQARPLSDCDIKVPMRDDYKSLYKPDRTTARLLDVIPVTHDIREFRFALRKPRDFLPGQYALIKMPGVGYARAYSMSNAGDPDEWHFQVRRVPAGRVTTVLFDELKVGDEVGLDGPYGMAFLREDAPRDVICMADGSGLAPMVSIARAFASSPKLKVRKLHFIHGGRTPKDLCGDSFLAGLPGFGERLFYHCAISDPQHPDSAAWDGRSGSITDVAVELFDGRWPEHEIYFAGPPAMAEAVLKTAIANKVSASQLHFDKFY
jgi:toluene monooxygenase electron transfer component